MKRILSLLRRAVQDFNMIKPGDRIAVGLSGGKDSIALLHALKRFQYFSPTPFELEAITLTMGMDDPDLSPLINLCKDLKVPYTIKETKIGRIVFDVRREKNPCSLCANMRRGALHNAALERNCNKVALGHHKDDVIETFLLSLMYEGRLNTFMPVTYLTRKKITLIRPLIYAGEREIAGLSEKYNFPVVKNPCPASGRTKRQYVKELVSCLEKDIPDIREKILGAIKNKDARRLW
ncbi:MAG TPA: tRNA 2-thiocytidine(32) synthetase TtcA [Clostridiales bacterium]|nr:tRNA 2-thiocytidine(32) synthetase TtcA [Clostridiales bacterium]